ncbi:replication factor C subunit 5 [Pelagophyceae sp. CCMP2097]|nr:replication factor C subunit 5 [Pelagophyceae sp. CCMP2097]|mmetsp:Transcript_28663/g.98629  ORF Transcript_28663/g.98629 Transcript_28663/m.98629 type:complete len:343 (+) Transcript_28663:23-1051(+)
MAEPASKRTRVESAAAKAAGAPWVEKYRPSSLDELVAHKEIISVLKRLIHANKLPHLLLYGPPGTGKTSTIVAAAKDMYGKAYKSMTLELNASDDRGIDVVRNEVKEFASSKRLFSTGVKLIILDEADMMTNDAQAALRRVIEKYTTNCRFCLVCNYVNKIIPALQSRCTKFRFAPLAPDQVRGRVQMIAQDEKLVMADKALEALLELGCGDMRRILNILQATSVAYPDEITYDSLFVVTGNPLPSDIDAIYAALLNETFKDARRRCEVLCATRGYALADVVHLVGAKVLDTRFPAHLKAAILDKLSDVEYRSSFATDERLQLSSFVAAFVAARQHTVSARS